MLLATVAPGDGGTVTLALGAGCSGPVALVPPLQDDPGSGACGPAV